MVRDDLPGLVKFLGAHPNAWRNCYRGQIANSILEMIANDITGKVGNLEGVGAVDVHLVVRMGGR